jgi:glutamyl-tRNA synthetase
MMHIGTARTALFNWLYARHHKGTFLLRIEDTDRERSTEPAVQAIFDGLNWLELTPDAPPTFQFARADRHREVVMELLARGGAYRCYMTVEEVEEARQKARAEGHAIRSPWRDREPPGSNAPHVIRFRAPLEGETIVHDLVKGDVRFQNKELDDLVLLRSDGAPTYNLAVVVDDHDMNVSHVIRGDDHLSNAARQSLIYQAMGWEVPAFAHLPMIHGPDGAKLSKRHGAQAVAEFAEMGYLPEGMRNYLARLGWGHGDDEVFSDAEAIAWFELGDVVSSPARLDWAKLNFINGQHIRQADDRRLAALVKDIHEHRGVHVSDAGFEALARTIALVKDGAKTLLELADMTLFVLKHRPLTLDEKAQKLLTDETRARLGRLKAHLAAHDDWTVAGLEPAIRAFAEADGVGIGKFGQALRGVLSGGAAAPDLASALTALTREESLGRIEDALSQSQQTV